MLKTTKNDEMELDEMTERKALIERMMPLLGEIPMERLRALYIKALVANAINGREINELR